MNASALALYLGCAVAAWRGAFLAHGSLTEPGRSCALEITCPGPESALALVGAARRIGVAAKIREVRGVDRVVVPGDDLAAVRHGRAVCHAEDVRPGHFDLGRG